MGEPGARAVRSRRGRYRARLSLDAPDGEHRWPLDAGAAVWSIGCYITARRQLKITGSEKIQQDIDRYGAEPRGLRRDYDQRARGD